MGFYLGETFPHFVLAEVLTALSICFWSGSFEAWAIDSSEMEKQPGEIKRFFLWNLGLNQAAVLVFGFTGAWIGQRDLSTAYLAALMSFLVLGGLLAVMPERHSRPERHPGWAEIRFYLHSVWSLLIKNREIRLPVVTLTLLQFFIQPILHYWQPFFLRWEGVTSSTLGWIFAGYCGAVSIASYILARKGSSPLTGVTTAVVLLTWGGMIASPSLSFSVLCFCGLQVGMAALRSQASAQVAALAPSDSRASVMSGVGWISRLGMLSSLGVLSVSLPERDPQTLLPEVLAGYLVLGATFGVGLMLYQIRRRTHATHPTG